MRVGVESYFLPVLCAVTQVMLQSGGVGVGGGVSYRDNLSLGSLMENRKALYSACERAAAGCDRQTASTPLHHSQLTVRALRVSPMSPCNSFIHHGCCWCVVLSNQLVI